MFLNYPLLHSESPFRHHFWIIWIYIVKNIVHLFYSSLRVTASYVVYLVLKIRRGHFIGCKMFFVTNVKSFSSSGQLYKLAC